MRGTRGKLSPQPETPSPSQSPSPPPQPTQKRQSGTTYFGDKRVSQWEDLMKKFCAEHKEECQTVSLDIPKAHRAVKNLPTGSKYGGTWDVLGMSGFGTYTFPNGVIYEGDFEDGMFHGTGELQYDDGAVLKGKWKKGVMTEKTLLFSDSLEYKEEFWKYCVVPDRRFAIEYDIDVMPAGKSYLTAEQPTKEIPPGHYDCGDGFYDSKTKGVYKYDDLTAITRSPSVREQKWIVNNCRVSPEVPLGPRPDLYERWSEPVLDPKPPPPPAAGVKSTFTSFRPPSIFEADFDFNSSTTRFNFYDASHIQSDAERRLIERPIRNFKFDSKCFMRPSDTKVEPREPRSKRTSSTCGLHLKPPKL